MNDETKHRARSKYSCENPMVFMLKYSRSRFITGVFSLQRFRSFFPPAQRVTVFQTINYAFPPESINAVTFSRSLRLAECAV